MGVWGWGQKFTNNTPELKYTLKNFGGIVTDDVGSRLGHLSRNDDERKDEIQKRYVLK